MIRWRIEVIVCALAVAQASAAVAPTMSCANFAAATIELNLSDVWSGFTSRCADPRHARYVGSGATNEATSFE